MQSEYLLDTNAFFNILQAMSPVSINHNALSDSVKKLLSEKLYISTITKVEIISVLGKYARGNSGGFQKCNCIISKEGHVCQHNRYIAPRPKWSNRRIKIWLKFIEEIFNGQSPFLEVEAEPFNAETILEAQKIIQHALIHNFASMDAFLAATAKIARDHKREVTVITSDKGLKACLGKCNIPYRDIFV